MKSPDEKPNQADGTAPDKAQALRNRAEETLRAREDLQPEALGTEETRRLLHELRVHQIELEMQNGELRPFRWPWTTTASAPSSPSKTNVSFWKSIRMFWK